MKHDIAIPITLQIVGIAIIMIAGNPLIAVGLMLYTLGNHIMDGGR
jgi:hypothetical protein